MNQLPATATHPAPHTPRRILLICTQRIGDVLLTTPLARSLKRAWPEAKLDMLVFRGTEGALQGNPDIAQVITVPRRATLGEKFAQLRSSFYSLWRDYDLALSPLPTDRAHLYCWIAGKQRIGLLQPLAQGRLKRLLLNQWEPFDDLDTHTVAMGLRLAEMLGITLCYEVAPPRATPQQTDALLARLGSLADTDTPFAVLHVYPKFNYKMWPQTAWVALAQWLHTRGLGVVLTGGSEADELAYVAGIVDSITRHLPAAAHTLNFAGSLSLGETAELIRRARLYVGPDTAVTHIAAATGTPVIALFGPSNPVKWGPWPSDWNTADSPWKRRGSGRQGNVFLLQGPGDCVPCLLEGCDRHVNSGSECLRMLTVDTVIQAATILLSEAIR
ncbi:MAG: glycosyltransferase family 9 protein [Betaproteobacteria bacterium]|nr:glycosyltransferase family 9 protein [Betaproteobacteria bacterium]